MDRSQVRAIDLELSSPLADVVLHSIGKIGKAILDEMFASGNKALLASEIANAKGWLVLNDTEALTKLCAELVKASPEQVRMHEQGTRRVIKYFMGEVMKQTKGRAQPELVSSIFMELLGPYGAAKNGGASSGSSGSNSASK